MTRVFCVGRWPLRRAFANAIKNPSDSGVIEYFSAYFHIGTRFTPIQLGRLVFFRVFAGVMISGDSHAVTSLTEARRSSSSYKYYHATRGQATTRPPPNSLTIQGRPVIPRCESVQHERQNRAPGFPVPSADFGGLSHGAALRHVLPGSSPGTNHFVTLYAQLLAGKKTWTQLPARIAGRNTVDGSATSSSLARGRDGTRR